MHNRQGRGVMHEFHMGSKRFVLFFALLYLAGFPPAAGAEGCEPWVARLSSVQGHVERRVAGQEQWRPAGLLTAFCEGDAVRVRDNSRAALTLNNDTIVRLDQNTTVTFTGMRPDEPAWLDLVNGIAHFISR